MFLFGAWTLTEEGSECFAMEFPDLHQYSKDPLEENFETFQGLNSVSVTARFHGLFWAGFVLETLILVMIILNMIMRNKLLFVSNMLGYLSFVWFIILLFFRFDHYGQVCSGDLLDGAANKFEAMERAGWYLQLFAQIVGYCVCALFGIVFLFTCCADSRVEVKEDDDKK